MNTLSKDQIEGKITELLQNQLESDLDFHGDIDLLEYGFDSIKSMMFSIRLEEAFGIDFDAEDLMYSNFATVNKISEIVMKKLR
ncbi:acyl carrier protein [Fontibacillus phaseoli]|uniref:Acyl carrier protein n=1 Tax=Fontibacillus phaseoli TaxID=1416533 RepID=A0A369B7P9_9BACL|nr:acyl carrier protein [Fontibacillus phaseoli]RCX17335.1 acyl carrier protein [Fontibacillus phaseoli]